jgi:hypothetical protein
MSLSWSHATLAETRRLEAIYILFGGDDSLLDFFFHHTEPGLRLPTAALLKAAARLDAEEFQLVSVGVGIWSGTGGARVGDVVRQLDDDRLTNFIKSISHLREIRESVLHGLIDIESPSFHI